MKYRIIMILIVAGWIGSAMPGCGRESPPDVPAYKNPAALVFEESTVPEPQPLSGVPAAPPRSAPPAMPVKVQVPVQAEQKVAAPVVKSESSAPSLIGTWLAAEMIVNGRSMPMPPGMQITLTFAEGGSVTMSISGNQMPQGKNEQGTYMLTGEQFTMTIHNKPQSGTCRFEGPNRVTLDMSEAKMVLTRM